MMRLPLALLAALVALPLSTGHTHADGGPEDLAASALLATIAVAERLAADTDELRLGHDGPAPDQPPDQRDRAPVQLPGKGGGPGGAWSVHLRPEAGFSVALPPGWQVMDVGGLDSIPVDTAAPPFESSFLAATPTPDRREVLVLVGAMRIPPGQATSLDELADALNNLPEPVPQGFELLINRRVSLPAGPAQEVQIRVTSPPEFPEPVSITVTLYVLLENDRLYLLALAGPTEQVGTYAPVFGQIVQSFQFI